MAQIEVEPRRRGLTKIELVLVLTVALCFIGVAVISVNNLRVLSLRIESVNNLKQTMLTLHSANDAYRRLPPAIGFYPVLELGDEDPQTCDPSLHGTVFYHSVPFIESSPVWWRCIGMSRNVRTKYGPIPIWHAPGDFTFPTNGQIPDGQGAVSYAANGYVLGGGTYDFENKTNAYFSKITLKEISEKDGTANTIAFAERFARCTVTDASGKVTDYQRAWSEDGKDRTPWSPVVWRHDLLPQFGAAMTEAGSPQCDPEAFQAFNSWSIQVVMFDGHTRSVSSKVSQETWSNAMRHDDGNELGEDF
jgi:hypothetical protein